MSVALLDRGVILATTVEAEHAPPRTGIVRDSLASLERTRSVLGYEPEVDLREGIRRTAEWLVEAT